MVMATYKPGNSVPRVWYPGLKDESTRAQTYEPPKIPMHAPLFFTFAPKGQRTAQFASGSTARLHYGSEAFDEKSKYGTLVTPFLNLMNKKANPYLIQRLIPEDAGPESTVCLALELIETDKLKEYRRNSDGSYQTTANNTLIETGSEVSGVIAEWKIIPVKDGEIGKQEVKLGTQGFYDNDATVQSKIYPIMELKAQWVGECGNNIGVRLYAPVQADRNAKVSRICKDQRTAVYGIEIVERENARSAPRTVKTILGEKVTYFSFKDGAYDKAAGNASVFFDEIFLDAYQDIDGPESAPLVYGEIGDFHVYHEYIEEVLGLMLGKELDSDNPEMARLGTIDPVSDCHLINFFSGCSYSGRPYNAIRIRNVLDGARVQLGGKDPIPVFLTGGSDGEMNNKVYDDLVRKELENFGAMATQFLDQGRYPFKQFYDVGFTGPTKEAIASLLIRRQDVNVTLSTVDLITNGGRNIPSIADESSIASGLYTMVTAFTESEEFGTPAYRAVIVPSVGKILNNPRYRKWVPMTYEIAGWRAEYMSQPGGMKAGHGYDAPPYNHVQYTKAVSNPWMPANQYEKNWTNSLSSFRYKTDRLLFCPGLKTVYADDTSILTSDLTMQATCDINAYCYFVWASLTGASKYTDAELIEISNEMISNYCRGRYDGRFVIVPNTHLDKSDVQNGYSWTCQVDLYGNNMKTVMKSFIITHRMGDLNG